MDAYVTTDDYWSQLHDEVAAMDWSGLLDQLWSILEVDQIVTLTGVAEDRRSWIWRMGFDGPTFVETVRMRVAVCAYRMMALYQNPRLAQAWLRSASELVNGQTVLVAIRNDHHEALKIALMELLQEAPSA